MDKMCLVCEVTKKNKEEVTTAPREGAYVHGLYMEVLLTVITSRQRSCNQKVWLSIVCYLTLNPLGVLAHYTALQFKRRVCSRWRGEVPKSSRGQEEDTITCKIRP